jgi:carbamoyl-phosphate synthase small subunit
MGELDCTLRRYDLALRDSLPRVGPQGAKQPVKDLPTGKVSITSQNHGFAIDPKSLNTGDVEITQINLNDQTVEGMRHRKLPIFSVQYHPEAPTGPHDTDRVFDRFGQLILDTKKRLVGRLRICSAL